MRLAFDKLSDMYAKYYGPTEHLAIDEIAVLFTGGVIFRQYIPKKKKKMFGIDVHMLCDCNGYAYNI
jgi:hypothetical protein